MSSSQRDADTDAPGPRTDWGRVADGVGLAGLGVFFLVATTRGLPDGFWVQAVSFWPVLLVSAGIRIVFEKTAWAAGMVLGPVVVVGALFWLAWGHQPKPLPPGEWHEVAVEKPKGTERARVEAELAGVQLNLEARSLGPTLLVQGRAASRDGTPRVDLNERDDEADLRLRGRDGGFTILGMRREVWELGLADSLPLKLDLSGAFIRGAIDLRPGQVDGAKVRGAFNSWTFRLPPPSQRVRIHFQGAFSTFDVKVPEGTAVHYDGPGFPLVWLDRGPARDAIGEGEPGYEVVLEGAFSVVNIEEGPPPEGGWPTLEAPATPPAADTPDGPPPEAVPTPAEDPAGADSTRPVETEEHRSGQPVSLQ
jgi:hypothetical protein